MSVAVIEKGVGGSIRLNVDGDIILPGKQGKCVWPLHISGVIQLGRVERYKYVVKMS